jgi:hypothetical protein
MRLQVIRLLLTATALALLGVAIAPANRAALAVDDAKAAAIYGGDCKNKSSLGKCKLNPDEPKCKATSCYTFASGGVERGIFQEYCTGDSELTLCDSIQREKEVCQTTTTGQ